MDPEPEYSSDVSSILSSQRDHLSRLRTMRASRNEMFSSLPTWDDSSYSPQRVPDSVFENSKIPAVGSRGKAEWKGRVRGAGRRVMVGSDDNENACASSPSFNTSFNTSYSNLYNNSYSEAVDRTTFDGMSKQQTLREREIEYARARVGLAAEEDDGPGSADLLRYSSDGALDARVEVLEREVFNLSEALAGERDEVERVKKSLIEVSLERDRAVEEKDGMGDMGELRGEVEGLRRDLEQRRALETQVRELLRKSEARCKEMEDEWIKEQDAVEMELQRLRDWKVEAEGQVGELERERDEWRARAEKAEGAMSVVGEPNDSEIPSSGFSDGQQVALPEVEPDELAPEEDVAQSYEKEGPVVADIEILPPPPPTLPASPAPLPMKVEAEGGIAASIVGLTPVEVHVESDRAQDMIALAADGGGSEVGEGEGENVGEDDDVKSIEWIPSTVSPRGKVEQSGPQSRVLEVMSTMGRVSLDVGTAVETTVVKPATKAIKSPKKKGSPIRSKGSAPSSPRTPPVPPRPKRKTRFPVSPSAAAKPTSNEDQAVRIKPYVVSSPPVIGRESLPNHLIATRELQLKYRREKTPERKKKGKSTKSARTKKTSGGVSMKR